MRLFFKKERKNKREVRDAGKREAGLPLSQQLLYEVLLRSTSVEELKSSSVLGNESIELKPGVSLSESKGLTLNESVLLKVTRRFFAATSGLKRP